MNVFLTGATGYIGHELALALANNNIKVHALIRDLKSKRIPSHDNIIVYQGDVCDYDSVLKAIEGCCYVIHSAAYTNLKCNAIANFYNTNVLGTENVLRAALKQQVKKFIYTSTLSVYGPSFKEVPITEDQPRMTTYANDYELTKSMGEELVKKFRKEGLSTIILNISRVYGPGLNTFSNGVNRLVSLISKKDFILVPNKLKVVCNYVYINDVVDAHLLALNSPIRNRNYIIGGENVTYSKFFSAIIELTNTRISILKINYKLLSKIFSFVTVMRFLVGLSPSITPKVLDALFVNRATQSDRAITELNYRPTPLFIGLKKTTNVLNDSL